MNIYIFEFKKNIKSILIWSMTLVFFAGLTLLFYPSIQDDMELFENILNKYPPALKAAMGFMVDSFTSLIGYYSFAFTYVVIFGTIQAANLGLSILSKEERDKTADFLLTKPTSRTRIITSKILSSLTSLIITNIIYYICIYLITYFFITNDFSLLKYTLINISLFLLQLIFFSIGLIISLILKKVKTVLPISLGLVFMFYAISAFAVNSKEDKLRYITPFQYFKTDYIIAENNFELKFLILGFSVIIISLIASYVIYLKKDIHAV